MIVLDADVISEAMRPRPDAGVLAWLRRVPPARLGTTATVLGELAAGLALLPAGSRRNLLQDRLDLAVEDGLRGGVLPFDADAALAYALVVPRRLRQGRPIGVADAQIAAVCLVHDATLATRGIRDFEGLGVAVVNPWEA